MSHDNKRVLWSHLLRGLLRAIRQLDLPILEASGPSLLSEESTRSMGVNNEPDAQ